MTSARPSVLILTLTLTLAVGLAWVTACAAAELRVERQVFAREMEAREPRGVAEAFPPDVGQLYFFTQLAGPSAPTEILHVWIYDGREVAAVPLAVGGSPWRTWSSKRILPQWVGDWSVEVRDREGAVLAIGNCRVQ